MEPLGHREPVVPIRHTHSVLARLDSLLACLALGAARGRQRDRRKLRNVGHGRQQVGSLREVPARSHLLPSNFSTLEY